MDRKGVTLEMERSRGSLVDMEVKKKLKLI